MPEEEVKYPENTQNKNRSPDVLPGKFVFVIGTTLQNKWRPTKKFKANETIPHSKRLLPKQISLQSNYLPKLCPWL